MQLQLKDKNKIQYNLGRRSRGQGGHALQFFRNRRIFRNFNASSENFRTFAATKDKGFEFYRKIIELGSTGPTTPLNTTVGSFITLLLCRNSSRLGNGTY